MWVIIGAVIVFTSWVIAPFLPKEKGASPVVIHNSINITNNPSAPSQGEPKQKDTSEEGLFGRDNSRIRF